MGIVEFFWGVGGLRERLHHTANDDTFGNPVEVSALGSGVRNVETLGRQG